MTPETKYNQLHEVSVLLDLAAGLTADTRQNAEFLANLRNAREALEPLLDAADTELSREALAAVAESEAIH